MDTQPVATDQTCTECGVAVLALTSELMSGVCFRCRKAAQQARTDAEMAAHDAWMAKNAKRAGFEQEG